ncbi:MAG: LytR/AlgR family response regulator transcription factor [Blastocatellia bacterium]|jgi:two-component system LytT family response regulator
MSNSIRVLIADDERPARSFLAATLRSIEGVTIVGEATNGAEAVTMIEKESPDLALLDLQMPEVDGMNVLRLVRKGPLPLVAFVTAYDEYAISAFEADAVDYLLKPVDRGRLQKTIHRAVEWLERLEMSGESKPASHPEVESIRNVQPPPSEGNWLQRIPIRRRDDILILPIREVASIVAEGDILRLTTLQNNAYTMSYRLRDLESRLDPRHFIRLSRGTIVNLGIIRQISPMPGGTYIAQLTNGQKLTVSRIQGRYLRDQLLRI